MDELNINDIENNGVLYTRSSDSSTHTDPEDGDLIEDTTNVSLYQYNGKFYEVTSDSSSYVMGGRTFSSSVEACEIDEHAVLAELVQCVQQGAKISAEADEFLAKNRYGGISFKRYSEVFATVDNIAFVEHGKELQLLTTDLIDNCQMFEDRLQLKNLPEAVEAFIEEGILREDDITTGYDVVCEASKTFGKDDLSISIEISGWRAGIITTRKIEVTDDEQSRIYDLLNDNSLRKSGLPLEAHLDVEAIRNIGTKLCSLRQLDSFGDETNWFIYELDNKFYALRDGKKLDEIPQKKALDYIKFAQSHTDEREWRCEFTDDGKKLLKESKDISRE